MEKRKSYENMVCMHQTKTATNLKRDCIHFVAQKIVWSCIWTRWSPEVPSNPYHSVILWFSDISSPLFLCHCHSYFDYGSFRKGGQGEGWEDESSLSNVLKTPGNIALFVSVYAKHRE